jgi:hypothetical protein
MGTLAAERGRKRSGQAERAGPSDACLGERRLRPIMTSPSQAKGQPFQIPIWVGALDEGEP